MNNRLSAVIALGMFDGMHLGHRALIRHTVETAERLQAVPAVYTFSNHPLTVLGGAPEILTTSAQREACMRALGVRDVCMEPFTRTLADCSPEEFIDRLSVRWNIRALVAGYNYTFGKGGKATPEELTALGRARGFSVQVIPPVLLCGEPVSSTRIRKLLLDGDAAGAAACLGTPYALTGFVVANRQNGRKIGFPTANLAPEDGLLIPKDGVYAARACAKDVWYPAVTNIGENPTLDGRIRTIETHLIGFSGDLYGAPLTVELLRYLRPDRRFDSLEALRSQIAEDAAHAMESV